MWYVYWFGCTSLFFLHSVIHSKANPELVLAVSMPTFRPGDESITISYAGQPLVLQKQRSGNGAANQVWMIEKEGQGFIHAFGPTQDAVKNRGKCVTDELYLSTVTFICRSVTIKGNESLVENISNPSFLRLFLIILKCFILMQNPLKELWRIFQR